VPRGGVDSRLCVSTEIHDGTPSARARSRIHLLAQRLCAVGVVAIERLDRTVHSGPCHLRELLIGEPSFRHCRSSSNLKGLAVINYLLIAARHAQAARGTGAEGG